MFVKSVEDGLRRGNRSVSIYGRNTESKVESLTVRTGGVREG